MMTTQRRDLHGLKALVTGATSGLGRAVALQLARDGADIAVHDRDATRGNQTVEAIQSQGGSAHFVAADLNDAASVTRLAKEAGDIDILVNNAGFAKWGPTETFEIASFDALFAANVRAPFFLVAAFAPGMVTRGTGSIINISSMAGRLGLSGGAHTGPPRRLWLRSLRHGRQNIARVAFGSTRLRPARFTRGRRRGNSSTRWGPPPP
jgi:NAD(P)-dependent dehydrogenase (short-subunit alcohol dehydrogenase family)